MECRALLVRVWLSVLAAALWCPAMAGQDNPRKPESAQSAESMVVDKWRGTWEVKATRRQPQPEMAVNYVETYDWVLDGRYLRSETSRKSDGGKSMSMVWFDANTKNYRFVIFDANGLAVELPPPTWSENTQTMEWRGGMFSPVAYTGYATFTNPDTIRWKSLLKDWKGTVIVDLEGVSVRRK